MKFFAALITFTLCVAVGYAATTTVGAGTYSGSLSNCEPKNLGKFSFTVSDNKMTSGDIPTGTLTKFEAMNFTVGTNTLTTGTAGCWDFKQDGSNWLFYIPTDLSATCLGQTCTKSYVANVTYTNFATNLAPHFLVLLGFIALALVF